MLKFIHLTNAYNDLKVALNIEHIVGFFEQPDGEVAVEFRSTSTEENVIRVKESFDEIEKMIYEYNNKVGA
jgi:hypothetical protein|nr:MAG TPA: Flagellar and Swarming motility protein [Caudoviricetes sp.]